MSIRLSKACKDLNVGMSTAVEFLSKKGHKIVATYITIGAVKVTGSCAVIKVLLLMRIVL